MVKYTIQEQVFLYETFVKFKSAKKCRKSFRTLFPGITVPSKSFIHKLVNNVRTTGSILDEVSKRKHRALTAKQLNEVFKKFAKKQYVRIGLPETAVLMSTDNGTDVDPLQLVSVKHEPRSDSETTQEQTSNGSWEYGTSAQIEESKNHMDCVQILEEENLLNCYGSHSNGSTVEIKKEKTNDSEVLKEKKRKKKKK